MLAIALAAIVLLQRSEGGALGIGGGGGGGGLVSSRGAGNILTKATWTLAALFMLNSIVLTILAGGGGEPTSIFSGAGTPSAPVEQPAPSGPSAPVSQ